MRKSVFIIYNCLIKPFAIMSMTIICHCSRNSRY